ncbi:MAG: thiamine-phosphate kinase [Nitriliruptorales bacterium]|nr:thiamine-phosphate kinase [Nitriliruptorales bacterium]
MVGEFDLIAAMEPFLTGSGPDVPLGTGDDAAVVDLAGCPVVVAVDTLVDEIHFDRSISSLEDVGWKALAVNVSDVAAVGATATAAVVSLQRPAGFDIPDVEALYGGISEGASRWGCAVVGGDTVGGPVLAVSVTILGVPVEPGRLLRRDAASPGQLVVLIGRLGLAAAGLALARADRSDVLDEHPDLLAAHRRPDPQHLAAAPLVVGGAQAGIDVSDGLGRDLGHIADESGVGIRIEAARLPRHPGVVAAADALGTDPLDWIVGGGDDYALLATVEPDGLHRVETALEASGIRSRVIGEVTDGDGVTLRSDDRPDRDLKSDGWEHP